MLRGLLAATLFTVLTGLLGIKITVTICVVLGMLFVAYYLGLFQNSGSGTDAGGDSGSFGDSDGSDGSD